MLTGRSPNNPQAPFINSLMAKANLATNYYAIAHPSNTNYLEVVGGSNFNKLSDQYPDWHNANCVAEHRAGTDDQHRQPEIPATVCPISGKNGTDAAIPVLDNSQNETSAPPLTNINGKRRSRPSTKIDGISIADQLVTAGKSWKSYQEGLPHHRRGWRQCQRRLLLRSAARTLQGVKVTSDFAALSTTRQPGQRFERRVTSMP